MALPGEPYLRRAIVRAVRGTDSSQSHEELAGHLMEFQLTVAAAFAVRFIVG